MDLGNTLPDAEFLAKTQRVLRAVAEDTSLNHVSNSQQRNHTGNIHSTVSIIETSWDPLGDKALRI